MPDDVAGDAIAGASASDSAVPEKEVSAKGSGSHINKRAKKNAAVVAPIKRVPVGCVFSFSAFFPACCSAAIPHALKLNLPVGPCLATRTWKCIFHANIVPCSNNGELYMARPMSMLKDGLREGDVICAGSRVAQLQRRRSGWWRALEKHRFEIVGGLLALAALLAFLRFM